MMTISEAQSVLHCPNAYGGIYGKKYGQALEAAFRCMEACEGSMTVEEYRQRMIQAFHNADCDSLIAIVSLPSEKEFEHLEWLLQTHYKKEPCDDCISRQAVVDWLTDRTEKYDEKGHFISKEFVKAEVKNWLAELPSVTPQPRTGHWIDRFPAKECKCSVCSFLICISNGSYIDMVGQMKYCPNCGAKIVEPQERSDKG